MPFFFVLQLNNFVHKNMDVCGCDVTKWDKSVILQTIYVYPMWFSCVYDLFAQLDICIAFYIRIYHKHVALCNCSPLFPGTIASPVQPDVLSSPSAKSPEGAVPQSSGDP